MTRIMMFTGLMTLLHGCGRTKPNNAIEGIYVKYTESRFSRAWDTLAIRPLDQQAGTFIVEQRTGYNRVTNGEIQAKQWEARRWVMAFDPLQRQLKDLQHEKVFAFDPSARMLFAGSSTYHKIR